MDRYITWQQGDWWLRTSSNDASAALLPRFKVRWFSSSLLVALFVAVLWVKFSPDVKVYCCWKSWVVKVVVFFFVSFGRVTGWKQLVGLIDSWVPSVDNVPFLLWLQPRTSCILRIFIASRHCFRGLVLKWLSLVLVRFSSALSALQRMFRSWTKFVTFLQPSSFNKCKSYFRPQPHETISNLRIATNPTHKGGSWPVVSSHLHKNPFAFDFASSPC